MWTTSVPLSNFWDKSRLGHPSGWGVADNLSSTWFFGVNVFQAWLYNTVKHFFSNKTSSSKTHVFPFHILSLSELIAQNFQNQIFNSFSKFDNFRFRNSVSTIWKRFLIVIRADSLKGIIDIKVYNKNNFKLKWPKSYRLVQNRLWNFRYGKNLKQIRDFQSFFIFSYVNFSW